MSFTESNVQLLGNNAAQTIIENTNTVEEEQDEGSAISSADLRATGLPGSNREEGGEEDNVEIPQVRGQGEGEKSKTRKDSSTDQSVEQ